MKSIEQKKAAEEFVRFWLHEKGYEKGQTVLFWEELLRDVYGVKKPSKILVPEDSLRVEKSQRFVDIRIPSTRVMIEQKGAHIDLTKPQEQSGMKEKLTPFQQAHHYILGLGVSDHPKWIVVCNFREFHIHDMERPNDAPEIVYLENLPNELNRLRFLVDTESTHVQSEVQVSMKAGDLVGELYDLLLKQYGESPTEENLRSLNVLCVRLVFCLYAEDAHVFNVDDQFHDYLSMFPTVEMRNALIGLFRILNTPHTARSKFERPELLAFPYVNGGLFDERTYPIEIPMFTDEIRGLLLDKASYGFNWSNISPTIFGAVFENTLNPKERRKGGMHYTSVENIHKLIGPLFLDSLTEELDALLTQPNGNSRTRKLEAFQQKLADIRVLDPACGSGNFLTETFLSLRRLENKVIREIYHGQTMLGEIRNPVKVSIEQFYGIEINDFAVNVGKTAMWIAESQMRDETNHMIKLEDDFLPLTRQTHIHHGNALRTEWSDIVKPEELTYIIGNPPFLGYSNQSEDQKAELSEVLKPYTEFKTLDYVTGWYAKSAQMMHTNPKIRSALVSTNSITQGEQVAALWKPLVERFGLHIDFAWRTFVWDGKANVHCIIIGFSTGKQAAKPVLFDRGERIISKHINAYLLDMEDIWVVNRSKPICDVPQMVYGSKPTGNFDVSKEELKMVQEKYPEVLPYIKRFTGATEFINGKIRYCLWLKGISPAVVRRCAWLEKRIEAIRKQREQSTKAATRRKAETPMLFDEDRQPDTDYLIVPRHSSRRRVYIPFGFMSKEVICGDANQFIPEATTYIFGIITSKLHLIWNNIIGGKIKSDPRYSSEIVYNNFPWPNVTEQQQEQVSELAQTILDIRAAYSDCSLADLYDPDTMPPVLRKAHRNLDCAVLKLYGLKNDMEEMDIVKHLLGLYKNIVQENNIKTK